VWQRRVWHKGCVDHHKQVSHSRLRTCFEADFLLGKHLQREGAAATTNRRVNHDYRVTETLASHQVTDTLRSRLWYTRVLLRKQAVQSCLSYYRHITTCW
jgi:hypothetical protein